MKTTQTQILFPIIASVIPLRVRSSAFPLMFLLFFALLAVVCGVTVADPLGTSFTYQGMLSENANPANGIYDVRFTIYDAADNGSAVAGPITNRAVLITDGLFDVELDFGPDVFAGNARWLEVGVRTNGSLSDFTVLSPRQCLTPAPYTIYATKAGSAASANSVAAANVIGTLTLGQLPGAVVTNGASGVVLSGTFTGNGAGLTNVNAERLDGQHGAYYQNAANLTSGTLSDSLLSVNVALRNTTNTFSAANVFTKSVGIDCFNPGRILQVGNANTFGSEGMIRLASRSSSGSENRVWDIGVPQTSNNTSGAGYSFVIDDTLLGTSPEFLVRWGTGRVGIGQTNPVSALDVNGTVTATGFSGNGSGLTNLNAGQISSGTVAMARLPGGLVTNNATGITLVGRFSGDASGMTNINLRTVNNQGAIGWSTNWGNFVLASSPGVGATPHSVAAADINSDGKIDVISANIYDDTLTVLTNNGSGGFTFSATLATGLDPYCVTAADVNQDGKPDLIAANSGANTLTVLTNRGNGVFALSATLTVGANPYAVVAVDINTDGKMDVITANQGDSTLAVLTNKGNAGFVVAATLPVGPGPKSVAAADVNGDGTLDLISANSGFDTVSVLTNNGSGGFTLSSSPYCSIFPESVAAADLNGDMMKDLIVANPVSDKLSVLLNNGSGGFLAASSLTVGTGPTAVLAVDLSQDGKVDLVSANFGNGFANTLSVLINTGGGVFATPLTLTVGGGPHSVAAADVNADGRPDLISVNAAPSTLSVLFNAPLSYGANFTGDGSGLSSLNAAQLTGTAGSLSASNVNVLGVITGNGSGLTNLNAAQITSGTLADARLSTNVAKLDAHQVFSGSNRFAGVVTLTSAANLVAGDGSGLTSLNASQLTSGAVPPARLPANLLTNNAAGVTLAGTFSGNGTGLTNLNASQLASGAVPLARLPAALLTNNAVGVTLAGAFSGNGSGLTNLNAGHLASGTVADPRLSTNVALLGAHQVFAGSNRFSGVVTLTNTANTMAGSFSGNGGGLTNLNAGHLASGTVPDARISTNVALLNAKQTFTGTNIFNSRVGIGTATPGFPLSFANSTGDKIALYGQASNHYGIGIADYALVLHASTASDSILFGYGQSTNLVETMRIKGNGYVGIGQTNPVSALDVNGTITATSLDVWHTETGTNVTALPNTSYFVNNPAQVTITLPASPNIGDVVRVSGCGTGGWRIVQNSGQIILAGNIPGNPVGANWSARGPVKEWEGVASSADGLKLVAIESSPDTRMIWTSTDGGVSWDWRTQIDDMRSVCSSADGTKLAIGLSPGAILTSTNSGVTWVYRPYSAYWLSIASSADGNKLVAAYSGGQLWTSIDSGATWAGHGINANWISVASSADGTKLVAGSNGGQIYTSTDSGTNWTARGGTAIWRVASSADGTKLVAVAAGGQIYTSTDSGTNWTARASAQGWWSVASSADGTKLVAVVYGGRIWTSTDSGVTWTQHGSVNRFWISVASSADGNRLFAAETNGQLYTSVAGTTTGTSGYLLAGQYGAIELQYIGNGQFMPLSYAGTITAY